VVGTQTNIGEKVNKVQEVVIYDESGKDVTSNYKINIVNGRLTVTPPQT
jgi:uncharacterized protein (UPF0210 family)